MTLTLQFVDSIAASPTVLFDLNDLSLTFVTQDGWSAPPPSLQRSITSSAAYDGSNVAQSSYNDREITVTVAIKSASQDAAATAIQAIGRLLNSDGQWLKLSTGTTNPVFFRTKRAEIDQLAEFNGQADGFRTATLVIPAEPFAYGLPESGTATIANDPTAGTNPMSYVFPTVKGDVATPLSLSVAKGSSNNTFEYSMLGACASPLAPLTPLYATTVTQANATAGWALTTTSDSTAITGTTNVLTKTSGTNSYAVKATFAAVPPGEYRVVGRFKVGLTTVGASADVRGDNQFNTSDPVDTPLDPSNINDWEYYDFGVYRLPSSLVSPTPPGLVAIAPSAATLYTTVKIVGSTGNIRLNNLMLVPSGLDGAQASSIIKTGVGNLASTVQIDAQSDSVWQDNSPNGAKVIPVAGSMPRVVPGQVNVITLVFRLAYGSDVKTETFAVNWLYYPHYLYVRPATT